MIRRSSMFYCIDALHGLVKCTILYWLWSLCNIYMLKERKPTFSIFGTTIISSLSPKFRKYSFMNSPFFGLRTVPRTRYPLSKSVRTTHMATNPFAPVTRTLLPAGTGGIVFGIFDCFHYTERRDEERTMTTPGDSPLTSVISLRLDTFWRVHPISRHSKQSWHSRVWSGIDSQTDVDVDTEGIEKQHFREG